MSTAQTEQAIEESTSPKCIGRDEWILRFALHLVKRSGITADLAISNAKEALSDRTDSELTDPEYDADEEMSYWED